MNDDEARKQRDKALLVNLVMMLASTVMQQLGKVVNPLTGKTQIDLKGAEATIDMIEMLEAKTNGNRDADEDKLLQEALSTCRLNFVETAKDQPEQAEQEEDSAAEEKDTDPAPNAEQPDEPTDKKAAPKDPKYRKSYG